MHGRLKVRSTAEQAEAKRQEREKKLKIYQKVTSDVNAKRQNDGLDEEALTLTGQLLIVNPDFYTLWNYRREILQQFKVERETSQIQEFCTKELAFLESCLPVNPKSYGIWHHRSWTMLFMPQPDWKRELKLCNVYLGHDERNFHCWDYRRFVVQHAKISVQEEFEFTSKKIKENFSNYSSWHYRSKLLPKIHPYSAEDSERIEETALLKEFGLVQNAFFTDPNDQSAWFYHRWLLGRAKNDLGVLLSHLRRSNKQITMHLLFNQPVKIEKVSQIVLKVNESEVQGDWLNPFKNHLPSYIWMDDVAKVNFSVSCEELGFSTTMQLGEDQQETWHSFSDQLQFVFSTLSLANKKNRPIAARGTEQEVRKVAENSKEICKSPWKISKFLRRFATTFSRFARSELTAVHNSFLENELESCQLLLEEEPENKWTILTIVLLMRAINPMKYTDEVDCYLKRLCVVDPYRCGYYSDLGSKYKLENSIERHFIKFKDDKSEKARIIDLNDMNLSSLCHMEQLLLMTEIDLSKNNLSKLDSCSMLQCAKTLVVDDNKLVTVVKRGTLNLPYLETLSLNNNNISDVSCLKAIQGCSSLQKLNLHNNPVTTSPEWRQEVKRQLPFLKELNGKQL